MEYQASNESLNPAGRSLPKPVKEIAKKMLQDGKTCEETARTISVRKSTIVAIRQELEGEGKLEMNAWKKEIAGSLGDFVQKGAERLRNEVDNIPLGQLTMAVAIAIDKVRDLSDAPTVRVETRLQVTQDELNKMFSLDKAKALDIPVDEQPTKTNEQPSPHSSDPD